MITSIGKKENKKIKINTIIFNRVKIAYIIVFILVCAFNMGVVLVNNVCADENSKKNPTNSRYIKVNKENVIQGNIDGIEVNIWCGLNNNAKMYSYSEVKVEFKNPGALFKGIIQLGIPQNEEGVLYSKNIQVEENSSKTFILHMPVNIQTEKISFEILDRSGKSLLKKDIKINVFGKDEVMVGILAEKPESVNYIATDSNSTYFYMNKDTMPTHYKSLDAIDILVLNRYKISELSAAQYVAITEWVKNGGTLVIGTGNGAAGFLGTFTSKYNLSVSGVNELEISFVDRPKDSIEELVKTKVTEDGYSIDESIWTNFWTAYSSGNYENKSEGIEIGLVSGDKVANMSIISAYVEYVKKYWITTEVAEIVAANGITIESASSIPIMQSIIDGKGKVIVASFDLGINDAYTSLKEQISSTILAYASIEDKTIYNKFLNSILGSAKGKTPNTIIYIGVLIIYVILMLATIIVMNKNNKTKNLIKVLPFYSIVVCGLLAIMGINTRIKGIHSSYFTITELQNDGKAELEKYFDITVPKNKIYKLRLKDNKDIYSVNTDTSLSALVSSDNDSFNTYITAGSSGVDVRFDGISTFDTKTFTMSDTVEAADKFETSLNCWENVYSGAISNNTSFEYEHVFIVTKTAVLYLGDMSKGEKVSETKIKHMNYTSFDELEYIIPNLLEKKADNQNSLDSKGKITPNGITRAMQYYVMSRSLSNMNKGCVFAISKNSSDLFSDDNIKEEGINVVTSEVDINYTAGEQRYIPNICVSDISYELGNYNYSTTTGSIYVVNNTIADFSIKQGEKITSLTFSTSSKEKKKGSRNFEGKVCFWNYTTNQYDEVFNSVEDKTITDFTNYVGSNNVIKIKFEIESDDIGYNVPYISAILTK